MAKGSQAFSGLSRWLMFAAGVGLVLLGAWLVFPERVRSLFEWIARNPQWVATLGGVVAVIIGVGLIRRSLRKRA